MKVEEKKLVKKVCYFKKKHYVCKRNAKASSIGNESDTIFGQYRKVLP